VKPYLTFPGRPRGRAFTVSVAAYVINALYVIAAPRPLPHFAGAVTIALGAAMMLAGITWFLERPAMPSYGEVVSPVRSTSRWRPWRRAVPSQRSGPPEGSKMSPASAPFPSAAEPAAAETQCVHCDQPIRPCQGEAALEKWNHVEGVDGCRFARFVHAGGERSGSHLCGKDTRVATPAGIAGGAG
jgi:hypothetical protein